MQLLKIIKQNHFDMLKANMFPTNYKLFPTKIAYVTCLSFFSCIYSQNYLHSDIDSILINENEKLRLLGKNKELLFLNEKFINVSKQQNYLKGEVLGYINIGTIYGTLGAYNTSLQYLQLAEKKIKNSNSFYLYSKLYQEYGQFNYVIGLDSKALQYNSMAMYFGRKITEPAEKKNLSSIYASRADFLYNKTPDSSLIYLHKALKIKPSPVIKCLIANYYSKQKTAPDSSSYYFNQALLMLEKIEYWNIQRGMTYYYGGNYYSQNEKYEKALEYYKKSVEILEKTKQIYTIPLLYKTIAETYEHLKDKNKERIYLQKYTNLKDSLSHEWNQSINLSAEKTMNKQTLQAKTKKTVQIYNLIIVCLAVSVFFFSLFKYRKNFLFTSKHKAVENIKEKPESITTNGVNNDLIKLAQENNTLFISKFKEVHPELVKKIRLLNPNISKSELSLCAMIWLGLSSKEIACNTFMQHRSVQTKKNRLRKKLNIPSNIDLYLFFRKL